MKTLTRKVWTDAALMALPRGAYELIDGKLIHMSPAGFEHGYMGLRIGSAPHNFVRPARLGLVFGSDTGFRLDPENVLCPDVSYASREWTQKVKHAAREEFSGEPPSLR